MIPAAGGDAGKNVGTVRNCLQPVFDSVDRAEKLGLTGCCSLQQLQKPLPDLGSFFTRCFTANSSGAPLAQNPAVGHMYETVQIRWCVVQVVTLEHGLPKALVVNFSTRHQGSVKVENEHLRFVVSPLP